MVTPHQGPTATCWGCALEVSIPSPGASFKCGWCGAITLEKRPPRKESRCGRWFWLRDLVTSVALALLILVIIGGGVATIFPVVFPSFSTPLFYFHSCFVLLLTFNIFFNHLAASTSVAGEVPPLPFGSTTAAPQGALEDCTFCDRCEQPKPSRAHHCRACKTCVMGMDHHCPFIANCVGADNQRAFMLLLLYAFLGCLYALCMGTWAFTKMAPDVLSVKRELWNGVPAKIPTISEIFGLLFLLRIRLSLQLIATGYLICVSIGIMLGAGILLKQQLDVVYYGETGIDSLQRGPVLANGEILPGRLVFESTWEGKVRNLERVLGRGRGGRWWLWLMPRWPRTGRSSKHKKAG